MPRYIDAEALKDVIQQHDYPLADRLNSVGNGMFTIGIFQAIDQMPTISHDDVRGVVHCCHCRHAEPREPIGQKTEIFCRLFCAGMRNLDYCSRGALLTNSGAKMEVIEDD